MSLCSNLESVFARREGVEGYSVESRRCTEPLLVHLGYSILIDNLLLIDIAHGREDDGKCVVLVRKVELFGIGNGSVDDIFTARFGVAVYFLTIDIETFDKYIQFLFASFVGVDEEVCYSVYTSEEYAAIETFAEGAMGEFITLETIAGIVVYKFAYCWFVFADTHICAHPHIIAAVLSKSANYLVRQSILQREM